MQHNTRMCFVLDLKPILFSLVSHSPIIASLSMCLSLHPLAEQGDANNWKMAAFLAVAAKHCRKAGHSLQLAGGIFNEIP